MKNFPWLKMSILIGVMTMATCVISAKPTKKVTAAPIKPVAVVKPVPIGSDLSKLFVDALAMVGTAPQDKMELLVKPGDMIAFMGDGITFEGGYIRAAQYILATNYPNTKAVFKNAGGGNGTAENMEPRFEKDVNLAEKPAFVFINAGLNEMLKRLKEPQQQSAVDDYKANIVKMVDKAQAAGSQVVLLTPTIYQEDATAEGNKRLELYAAAMKDIAKDKKCKVVDLHTMFISALAKKPASLKITTDGIHMNFYGDTIMAIGVLRALGVTDTTIAKTNAIGVFQVKNFGPLAKFAAELEVPPARFFKPSLVSLLSL
ncbi:MAG: SGNH/GDSL hydrolase family protein [bacterium]